MGDKPASRDGKELETVELEAPVPPKAPNGQEAGEAEKAPDIEVQTQPVALTFDPEAKDPKKWRLVPLPPGMRVRERFYGARIAAISVLGTIVGLLVVGGLVFFLMTRSGGSGSEDEGSLGGTPESIETLPGTTDTLPGGAPLTDGTTSGTGTSSEGSATPGATQTGGGATPGGPAILQPAFGTYTYKASGSIKDFMTRQYPSEFKARVEASTRVKGCWDLVFQYFSDQTQTTTFCPGADGSLTDVGGTVSATRPLASNEANITCDPPSKLVVPGMQPGAVISNPVCKIVNSNSMAGNATSAGPTKYVGLEMATVGNTRVETYHILQERTLTGGQSGPDVSHTWISTKNGMIVRTQHTQTLKTAIIPYTDNLTANLASLEPS